MWVIDELENSIHSIALDRFVKWYVNTARDLQIQIFATTHSLECIDAVLNSDIPKDDLSLFKIKIKENRGECKKIGGKELEELRYELGQDVRW